jgi:hypothetical protein
MEEIIEIGNKKMFALFPLFEREMKVNFHFGSLGMEEN